MLKKLLRKRLIRESGISLALLILTILMVVWIHCLITGVLICMFEDMPIAVLYFWSVPLGVLAAKNSTWYDSPVRDVPHIGWIAFVGTFVVNGLIMALTWDIGCSLSKAARQARTHIAYSIGWNWGLGGEVEFTVLFMLALLALFLLIAFAYFWLGVYLWGWKQFSDDSYG